MRKKKDPVQWTLTTALEAIWKQAEDCELKESFFKSIQEPYAYVESKFHISPIQAVFIAILTDASDTLGTRQISNFLDCSNITLLTYENELDELCTLRMVRHAQANYRGDTISGYHIEDACLAAIKGDKEFVPEDLSKITQWQFLQRVHKWIRETDHNSSNYNNMVDNVQYLLIHTPQLKLSQYLNKCLDSKSLDSAEVIFFLVVASYSLLHNMRSIGACHYDDVMEESYKCHTICEGISDGKNHLATLGLIENSMFDGVAERDSFCLSAKSCIDVLSEYGYKKVEDEDTPNIGLIKPEDIVKKTLYFNDEEGQQIDRLRDLLKPEKLKDVQARLKDSGLRTGFCVLMHGEPGTGKTESVYQVCKESGHPIYQVNISELKSKWVGDSEKQVQAMFEKYGSMVADAKRTNSPLPVMFLNEADAIMGRRLKGDVADSPVAKMENAIQNIILEGMERIEGIMVATTNLTDNLDEAMARRWIFTIRYGKPSADVKAKIFRSMIPELSASEAKQLAVEFPNFCGGQCENVTRRLKVEHVLYNTPFSVDRVRQLCKEEGIKKSQKRLIGFA